MNKISIDLGGEGVTLTCGETSVVGQVPGKGDTLVVDNPNDDVIKIRWGDSSAGLVATTNSLMVFPNAQQTVLVHGGPLYVAAIGPAGSSGLELGLHRGSESKD